MADEQDDGGSAWPWVRVDVKDGEVVRQFYAPGMSLRDWFAGQALQGMIAAKDIAKVKFDYTGQNGEEFPAAVMEAKGSDADRAYLWADAMLQARLPSAKSDKEK